MNTNEKPPSPGKPRSKKEKGSGNAYEASKQWIENRLTKVRAETQHLIQNYGIATAFVTFEAYMLYRVIVDSALMRPIIGFTQRFEERGITYGEGNDLPITVDIIVAVLVPLILKTIADIRNNK